MKRSMMKVVQLGFVLSLVGAVAACAASGTGNAASPQGGTSASASVKVKLDLPTVGNPKYDKFFNDVVDLAQLVADARAALETAPATLNAAMKVTDQTDFDTALKNISGKLKGKVTVTINVTPTGADVAVVPVAGVTLTADEQAMADAYKKVATDIAAIPATLAPVVAKTVDIAKQAVVLAASAKSDFTGFSGLKTLPSVVSGISKVGTAIDGIKTDVPVITDKSKTMTVAIKGAF
jgi:hypothetical protein